MSDILSQLSDAQAQSNQARIQFMQNDLTLCFTFATLADAEKGYATVQHFLSDPKHAKHIADDKRRELTASMEKLRERLDSLKR